MTVKQFFKSNAFKSLAVLLTIVILAGGLLAMLNDVFFVSEEEKFNRTLAKIYGGSATVSQTLEIKENEGKFDNGTVDKAYLMSDGNYLVQAKGTGGWQDGSITVWIVFKCEGKAADKTLKLKGIEKVMHDSNVSQSFIANLTAEDYAQFTKITEADITANKTFDKSASDKTVAIVESGATAPFTTQALINAVNNGLTYVRTTVLGVEVPVEPVYKYAFEKFVNMDATTFTKDLENKTVTYAIAMNKNGIAPACTVNVTVTDGAITAFSAENFMFEYPADLVDASLRDGSFFTGKTAEQIAALLDADGKAVDFAGTGLTTGATYSSVNLIRAAAFATSNFETILYEAAYGDWISAETHKVSGTTVTYALSMNKNGIAPACTVNVTVTDGAITAFSAENIAAPESFGDSVDASLKDGSYFAGKTLADLTALLDADGKAVDFAGTGLSTGATYSSVNLIRAAIYALANYDLCLATGSSILYKNYIASETHATVDGALVYTIALNKISFVPGGTVTVTVKDGAVTALSAEGFTTGDPFTGYVDESLKNGSYFAGKTLADLTALLDADGKAVDFKGTGLTTGATLSSTNLIRAAIYAVANYETFAENAGGNV